MDGIEFLRVKNGLPTKLKGMHHGNVYEWKPGESLDISIATAEHLFGFGLDDKAPAFHRLAWITSKSNIDDAYSKLEMISFDPIQQVFQMATQRKKPGRPSKTALAMRDAERTGNDRSLVNAGGAEGGEQSPPDDQFTIEDDEDSQAEAI